ncbi:MAG: PCRF domain-containing protein, partial [Firmicutes bacterium]|nr:PCRF domain-containing protein [Bacillota bacterium]
MFKKLDFILEKYDELGRLVSDPEVIADQQRWQKSMREMGDMEPVVQKYREYKRNEEELEGAKEMLNEPGLDDEMREMAKMELSELEDKKEKFEQELKILLLPKDPNDEKNVYVELRAGTGGEEAALFASDLLRM